MTTDTIIFIAQTIVLPATLIANLVVTVIIAVTSHRTTRRLTALEMLRGLDQQWQSLNAAILAQPNIQRHINPENDDASERIIVRRNLAFYVLNVALQIERGRVAGLIDQPTATRLREAQMAFLANLQPEVDQIIESSAIYRAELQGYTKTQTKNPYKTPEME